MNLSHNRSMILRFISWFFLSNSLLFWILGYGYLNSILQTASLFKNTFADYSSLAGMIFTLVFAIVNYLTYMMLLAFIPAIFLLAISLILPRQRLIWCLSVLVGVLSLSFLIADSRVYSLYKFHLNSTILSLFFNGNWYEFFDFSTKELQVALVVITILFILEIGLAILVWKKIIITQRFQLGKNIFLFWFGGFLFCYFTLLHTIVQNNNLFSQQTPNLPLFNQFFAYLIPDKKAADVLYRYSEEHFTQPLFSNDRLAYPLKPMRCSRAKHPTNIILIMVDSLRFDSLNKEHMPNLANFAQNSWQFLNHMSGGNATQPGLFSLFYSIPSNYWTAVLEQKVPPVLIQLLLNQGYITKILWSSIMTPPPFNQTIYSGISSVNPDGAPGNDIGSKDRYITDQAINFLKNKNTADPFFLNLFYDAPHGFCREQSYPLPYQPATKHCLRFAMSNDVDPNPYYNRYLNAVRFVDSEIGRLLTVIEMLGYLNNSIVLITADHGQEFNDYKHNYWGHAGNFSRAQVQIPLVIHWPNSTSKSIRYVTASYDVVPTLLKRRFNCQNPISDYSIGQDLLVEEARLPFIMVGSYSNMGFIEPDRLTTLRTSGEITVTDTQLDPDPYAVPRMNHLKKALELMRNNFAKNKF